MGNTKYYQGCGSGDSDDPVVAGSGACYDMGVHQCNCGATCNAELYAASEGIWSAECPAGEPESSNENPSTTIVFTPDEEEPKTAPPKTPPKTTSPDSSMTEDKESFASATVLHGLTIVISFGMLVSLL